MASPKNKSTGKPFMFSSPGRQSSKPGGGQNHSKSHSRSFSGSTPENFGTGSVVGNGNGSGSGQTTNLAGVETTAGTGSKRNSFSSNQQKAIIEHLLITKNTAPQKNYSHVPCKFFRQGACQAGSSCPFSHSLNVLAADQTPCKYFQKGNCRFGSKCANAHILPDGTRVNPPKQYGYHQSSATPVPMPIPARGSSSSRNASHHHRLSDGAISSGSNQRLQPAFVSLPALQTSNPAVGSSDGLMPPYTPVMEEKAIPDFDGEDFVPSELSDLLTPTELKRRNSRSSFTRKLSFGEPGSLPSTSSTAFGSFHESSYGFSMQQRNVSAVSSASTNYSPPNLQTFTLPTLNYTYQQEQRGWLGKEHQGFQSVWNNDAPSILRNSSDCSIAQLGQDLTKIKIFEEDEDRAADPEYLRNRKQDDQNTVDASHHEMQFYLEDLHEGIY
ncbi:LAFE_0G13300g1_1 [Lachancea fermentati]|uniref:LAFE_0G13300g1_1 n=1 Tax=Lachancea fermentati TaxID=4955 RepID=A0A1G4MIK6_LACFM|nr:LAFE_0G13300g1_1 [Lachancea fermentati]